MALNSKREQILEAIKGKLTELSSITTVERVRPSFDDLDSIANTQLPLIAIVGKLPKPVQKLSSRVQGQPDKFVSALGVEVICYAMDNVTPDSTVSNLADDIGAKLFEDPTYNKLLQKIEVDPEVQIGIWDPYVVFKMVCSATYIHGTGGI